MLSSLVLCLQLSGWMSAQVALVPRPKVAPQAKGTEDGDLDLEQLEASLALRLVDEGYRVTRSDDDAVVSLRLERRGEGFLLTAIGPSGRGRAEIAAGEQSIVRLEVMQRATFLVERLGGERDLQGEGLPRGVYLVVSGDAGPARGQVMRRLAATVLEQKLALTPSPRAGDLTLCLQLLGDLAHLRAGENGCDGSSRDVSISEQGLEREVRAALQRWAEPARRAKKAHRRQKRARPKREISLFERLDWQVRMAPMLGGTTRFEMKRSGVAPLVFPNARLDASIGARDGFQLWVNAGFSDMVTAAVGPAADLKIFRAFDFRIGTLLGIGAGMAIDRQPAAFDRSMISLEVPFSASVGLFGFELIILSYVRSGIGAVWHFPIDPFVRLEAGIVVGSGINLSLGSFFLDQPGNRVVVGG